MSGFSPGALHRHTYVLVEAQMVRDLKGDAVAAIVAARILFKLELRGVYDVAGRSWWRASQAELADETGLSRDQVRRAVERLIDGGFLLAEKHHLDPERKEWDQTLSYSLVEAHDAPAPNGHYAPPRHDEHSAPTPNPPLVKIEEDEKNLVTGVTDEEGPVVALFGGPYLPVPENVKHIRGYVASGEPLGMITAAGLDEEFEAWWKLYPRKVNKGGARKAYKTARKKAAAEQLTAGVRAYADRCKGKDPQYVAHGQSWLNGERWLDQDAGGGRRVADGREGYWAAGGEFR